MTGAQVGQKDAFNLLPGWDHLGVCFCLVCQCVVVLTPLHSMIESYGFIPAGVSGCYGRRTRQMRQMNADSSGNAFSALCLLNSKSIPAPSLWQMNMLLSGSFEPICTYIQYILPVQSNMTRTDWLLWKLWLVLRAAAALRSWDGFVSLVWAADSGIWRQHHPATLSKHQTPSLIRTESSAVWKFSKCFKMSKSVETPSQPRQASEIASLNEPRTFYAHRGIDSLQFQILAVGTFLTPKSLKTSLNRD